MKVMAWYSKDVFPLDPNEEGGLCVLPFWDELGQPSDRVLLTGISGVGKSTVLAGIHTVWACMEALLDNKPPALPRGSVALLVDGLLDTPVICLCAKDKAFEDAVRAAQSGVPIIGWGGTQMVGGDMPQVSKLRERRAEDMRSLPNVLLMDDFVVKGGESQAPGVGLGDALRALGTQPPAREVVMNALEPLLYGKRIELGTGAPRVRLGRGGEHALDDLSAGERRIVWLVLSIAYGLHPGGVLLADEPEMHLHPSQVLGLLTTLEQLALLSDGQLVLTSHTPAVWQRYGGLGVNVALEGRE